MSESTHEVRAGEARADDEIDVEPVFDRPGDESKTSNVPAIPPELVGNTTDIVSRDWTGSGEGATEDEQSAAIQDVTHGTADRDDG
jgi:hypothetical protein